jgi:hypothetical protein
MGVVQRTLTVDKLQLTGRNLGRVFNSRSVCMCVMQLLCFGTKLPKLMLKTQLKQLLGYLLYSIMLPALTEGEEAQYL